MNCKKCNAQTNGDIFCNSCSDEILKLYLVEKVSADAIEKRFGLLPNTINYWYNHRREQYGDDFSYLLYTNDKKNNFTKRFLAFIIDILACEIVVLFIAFFLLIRYFRRLILCF